MFHSSSFLAFKTDWRLDTDLVSSNHIDISQFGVGLDIEEAFLGNADISQDD